MKIRFTGYIIINPEEGENDESIKEIIREAISSSNLPYEQFTVECKEIRARGRPRKTQEKAVLE